MSTMQDAEAAIAYVRSKTEHKVEEAKFSYEHEATSTRTIAKEVTIEGKTTKEVSSEVVKSKHTRKVTLKVYSHSDQEDCEHFFECFERMQKELEGVWMECAKAKDKDATVLFQAFEHMLTGTATSEWHDVLNGETERKWETFKTLVSKFIVTKILPEDAYNVQVTYMLERAKPAQLSAKEWWLRMQTMNRYLPYFFKDLENLKKQFPNMTFKDWWKTGGPMSNAELRRIVTSKAPEKWRDRLRESDLGHEYRDNKDTSELVDYFTTLEALEQKRAKNTPRGRTGQARYYNNGRYNSRGSGRFANNRRFNSHGSGSGSRYGNQQGNRFPTSYGSVDSYRRYQNSQSGRYSNTRQGYNQGSSTQLHQNQGGRTGSSAFGRNGGRFGGQRNGRGGFQQRGQFQSRYQRPSGGQAYFQEDEEIQNDDSENYNVEEEERVTEEQEQGEMRTEDQWIDAWNESLYIDADEAEDDYGDEEVYYGDEDAAYHGSYYG